MNDVKNLKPLSDEFLGLFDFHIHLNLNEENR